MKDPVKDLTGSSKAGAWLSLIAIVVVVGLVLLTVCSGGAG